LKTLRLPVFPVAAVLSVSLIAAAGVSLTFGAIDIPKTEVFAALSQLFNGQYELSISQAIVAEMRLPRVLLAALVGGLLALAGVIIQALIRNPMADPYLLGVSNGASLAMVLLFVYGGTLINQPVLPQLIAGLGGFGAFSLVLLLAHNNKGPLNSNQLILAGIAISFMLSAITSLVMLSSESHRLPGIMQWMMGSLVDANWAQLPLLLASLLIGLAVTLKKAQLLDVLLLGDDKAATLGVNIKKHRLIWSALTALLTGVAVSQVGVVGFIGLMVPHFARFLVGGGHLKLIPIATLFGALMAILVDLLCRTLIRPEELPMGIPMAIIAMPFFIWLLRSNHAR